MDCADALVPDVFAFSILPDAPAFVPCVCDSDKPPLTPNGETPVPLNPPPTVAPLVPC